MAKVIHSGLAFANASSWAYWNAVDKERWKSRNRYFLIQLKPPQMNRIVSVYINIEEQDIAVVPQFSNLDGWVVRKNQVYCTNKFCDLQSLPVGNKYLYNNAITIQARSVCTIVYELETKI